MSSGSAWKVAVAGLKKLQYGDLGMRLHEEGEPPVGYAEKAEVLVSKAEEACRQCVAAGDAALISAICKYEVSSPATV